MWKRQKQGDSLFLSWHISSLLLIPPHFAINIIVPASFKVNIFSENCKNFVGVLFCAKLGHGFSPMRKSVPTSLDKRKNKIASPSMARLKIKCKSKRFWFLAPIGFFATKLCREKSERRQMEVVPILSRHCGSRSPALILTNRKNHCSGDDRNFWNDLSPVLIFSIGSRAARFFSLKLLLLKF